TAAGCTGSREPADPGAWSCTECASSEPFSVRRAVGTAAARHVGRAVADVVDKAILESFLGREPVVAVTIGVDLLDRLAGLRGRDLGEAVLHRDDEFGLRLDVARGAAEAAVRLVQQH